MENHETLTSGVSVDDQLDLTLRLGLPFQAIQKQDNAKDNQPKQDGEVDASAKFLESKEVMSTTTSNGREEAEAHSILSGTSNDPVGGILGSNDESNSKEIPKKCSDCGNETTPLWRRGPEGRQTLCNACGLRHARLMKRLS